MIEIEIRCEDCDEDLVVEWVDPGVLLVEPCPKCLKDKRNEGYEEGKDDGYQEGYDEMKEIMDKEMAS